MEKIILGMLIIRGLTIYEMKIFINNNLNAICSNSSGSIHAAVKKLLEKNLINCKEEDNKKIYYITARGREAFNNWILQPMDHTRAKNMELGKLFFLGLSDPAGRKGLILEYIKGLTEEHARLKILYETIASNTDDIMKQGAKIVSGDRWNEEGIKKNVFTDKLEDTISDVYKYQRATLQYGIEAIEFEIGWYSRYLDSI